MFLFGHIGVTLGIFFVLGIFVPRLKANINPKYLIIGALLPDLIDKPLGRVIFATTIANGRIIGHTLLFSLLIFSIGLYLFEKRRDIIILSLASGSFFHLMEDQMWETPKTLFWPLFGLRFPKDYIDNSGIWYLIRELENSFTFHFSQSSIPEVFGMGVIGILTLNWLIKRFRQDKL
jgi:hypothetical protein